MTLRRFCVALAATCSFAAAAEAAPGKPPAPGPGDPRLKPDLRPPPTADRPDMFAIAPLGEDAMIGLGRFSVPEPPRPRTNLEPMRDPINMERRRQGIGGLGLRMSF